MNQDRVAGTAQNAAGKLKEAVGKVTGNAATQAEGVVDQAMGAMQDAYGATKDAAVEGAKMVKDAAVEGEDILRNFIEKQPYTATLIALGVGLIIGYSAHRPAPPPPRNWW
jgi:uncharacterized protein YjbJ (UPF0337 family)